MSTNEKSFLTNEVKAGLFIVVTLTFLVMIVWVMGRERQIFARQESFFATFRDVKGLAPGAPVRLGGIGIGRVAKVAFSDDLGDPTVHITLLINEDYVERIRVDSRVMIETQGLLGDRYVTISAGGDSRQLVAGSLIQSDEGSDISQVFSKAGLIVDQTSELAKSANEFLAGLKGEGNMNSLTSTIESFSKIAKEVESGNGLVHRLIYDEKEGKQIIESLRATAKNVEELTLALKTGDGMLPYMISNPEGKKLLIAAQEAFDGVTKSAAEIEVLLHDVRNGKGIVSELLFAEPGSGYDEMTASLRDTLNHLKTASEALSSGTGTLGALLIDPKLYDNLVEVTDGAKRSFILREAIRSSLNQ